MVSVGCKDAFATACLPHMLCLAGDSFGRYMAPVTIGMGGRNRLFIEFCQEDVRDGVVD